MKKKINYIALFFASALFLGFTGCTSNKNDQADESVVSDSIQQQTEVVKTMEIQFQQIARKVSYATTLIPWEEIHMVPASPGMIKKINVEIGSRVSKGQVLVEMDKSQLRQAMIQLKNLETELQRLDTLRKAGSISEQQYDQVKTQYDVARENVDFLEDNTELIAPFHGVVTGKYFENSEMYSGTPNTQAGKAAIVTLAQVNPMKANVAVSESYLPFISSNTPVTLTTEVYGNEVFKGNLLRIHPSIDQATRTFITEIQIPNPDNKLRSGMSAEAFINLKEIKALMIPASAILKLQGSNERYVFINEDGLAKRVSVKQGQRYNEMVEVISDDISEGDQLIIAGQGRLLDGDPVKVVNQ